MAQRESRVWRGAQTPGAGRLGTSVPGAGAPGNGVYPAAEELLAGATGGRRARRSRRDSVAGPIAAAAAIVAVVPVLVWGVGAVLPGEGAFGAGRGASAGRELQAGAPHPGRAGDAARAEAPGPGRRARARLAPAQSAAQAPEGVAGRVRSDRRAAGRPEVARAAPRAGWGPGRGRPARIGVWEIAAQMRDLAADARPAEARARSRDMRLLPAPDFASSDWDPPIRRFAAFGEAAESGKRHAAGAAGRGARAKTGTGPESAGSAAAALDAMIAFSWIAGPGAPDGPGETATGAAAGRRMAGVWDMDFEIAPAARTGPEGPGGAPRIDPAPASGRVASAAARADAGKAFLLPTEASRATRIDGAGYRIRLVAPDSMTDAEIAALAAKLDARGFALEETRRTGLDIGGAVRFFHRRDAQTARGVAEMVGAPVADYSSYRPQPGRGTISVFLSGVRS